MQLIWQALFTQLALPLGSEQATQRPPQSTKPGLQVSVQLVPLQDAVPLGSVGHGVQPGPQAAVEVLETHCPLHCRNPALHVSWQVPALEQRAVPFGSAQAMHCPPHAR